jgi:hypothetical protein
MLLISHSLGIKAVGSIVLLLSDFAENLAYYWEKDDKNMAVRLRLPSK